MREYPSLCSASSHTSRAMWLVRIGTLCIVVRGGALIERWIDIGL